MDHNQIRARTVQGLESLAKKIAHAPDPQKISYSVGIQEIAATTKADLARALRERFPSGQRSLYSIAMDDQIDRRAVWHLIDEAKSEKRGVRAYCRVLPFRPSAYLYVGSSKTLPKRLLEHFGFGARSTYALQLIHWASELRGTITIEALGYPEIDQEILCALEDQMSKDLSPMFGRRGSL